MAKSALGYADGRQLAVDLLRELQVRCASDECFIEEGGGREPRSNLVLPHLVALRKLRSAAADAGFAAVLNDFIAGAYGGGVCDPETYEQHEA